MDRIVITIRPTPSDEALLSVNDAMQQVIDAIKILQAAERAVPWSGQEFVWRLESASTNSPFTVIALADPVDVRTDVSNRVGAVEMAAMRGLRSILEDGEAPPWVGPEEASLFGRVFARNLNGIGRTDINFVSLGDVVVSIDPVKAKDGLNTLEGINAIDVGASIAEREAFGEIEGVMIAAGRYRNQPAIQIRSELYGFVWCVLSSALINRFGGEHSISEVWEGRTVGVQGRLYYASGGRLARISAIDVREIDAVPIDLEAVLDPDFTAGMDPHEYLRRFHEGELA